MYKLPSSVLNELHCAVCSHYLSVGPIRIERNGAPICGRCKGSGEAVRTQSYDVLASIFAFPCKNYVKGCKALVRYSEVYNHEINCSYAPGCCFCCRHPCSGGKYVHPDEGVLIKIPDNLLDYVTCQNCNGFLVHRPIYLTPGGNNICHRCGPQNEDTAMNVPLELLLSVFILKCSYRIRGCAKHFKFGMQLVMHEANCEYKKVDPKKNSGQQVVSTPYGTKIRGVVPTHSGHVFATISQSHVPVFEPPNSAFARANQTVFFGDLVKHRGALEGRWQSDEYPVQLNAGGLQSRHDVDGMSVVSVPDYARIQRPNLRIPKLNRFDSSASSAPFSPRPQIAQIPQAPQMPQAHHAYQAPRAPPQPSEPPHQPQVHQSAQAPQSAPILPRRKSSGVVDFGDLMSELKRKQSIVN